MQLFARAPEISSACWMQMIFSRLTNCAWSSMLLRLLLTQGLPSTECCSWTRPGSIWQRCPPFTTFLLVGGACLCAPLDRGSCRVCLPLQGYLCGVLLLRQSFPFLPDLEHIPIP